MLPILPLKTALFPDVEMVVHVENPRYKQLITRCLLSTGELAVVYCDDYDKEESTLARVGCGAKIVECSEIFEGVLEVRLIGLYRFSFLDTLSKLDIFYTSDVTALNDVQGMRPTVKHLEKTWEFYQKYMQILQKFDKTLLPEQPLTAMTVEDVFQAMSHVCKNGEKCQGMLEMDSIENRFIWLQKCLQDEIETLQFIINSEIYRKAPILLN